MFGKWKKFFTAVACAAWCETALAQVPPVTILEVQLENNVAYIADLFDASKFATDLSLTPAPTLPRNFGMALVLADIVAVNGRPAKGIAVVSTRTINLRTDAAPGQAAADTVRTAISNYALEILQPDGTPIGSIYASGFSAGPGPPGAPLAVAGSNNAVVGGTGAFLGVRGQLGGGTATVAQRSASITEDPANRRRHGGGKFPMVIHLIPLSRPEIVATPTGPAVTHSNDFSLVTASRPARAGETLSLFATGLGPTRPGLDPGKPFPTNPLAVVNSPVDVTVNGKPAEVLAAVGYPGSVDAYQVNFRIPSDAERGLATIQLNAAWIAGPSVRVTVQ